MKQASAKDKIVLFIILAIAAGFFVLQPNFSPQSNLQETVASDQKTTRQISCNNPGTDLSEILDQQTIAMAQDICLYQHCSGFTY